MARPRERNKHLPKYVTVIHGSYWYRPPNAEALRLARVGDEATMYRKYTEFAFPAEPATPQSKLSEFFDRYQREVVPTLAPRTQKDYHRHLKLLRAEFGDMRPDDVKPRDVGRFLDVPKGKIQRVRVVAVLSAVYSKMVGKWYVAERNPCANVERHKNPPRSRYVTDEEYNAVYALMPPRMRVAMDLALLTGQRQGDILKLTWDDVLDDGVLFRQGKTGQSRLVLFVDPEDQAARKQDSRLWEVLVRARGLIPHLPRKYVLRNEDGQKYTSEGFRSIWQRYMRKAIEAEVLAERFTFHDLRAKTVSDEDDVDTAQLRAGHTSKSMTLRVYSRKVRKVTALR